MTRIRPHAVWIAFAALLGATPAVAQVHPPGHHALARQHRMEMDRLRSRADSLADFAERQHQAARLRALELQAARRPDVEPGLDDRRLGSPEDEAARRAAAQARARALSEQTGQIDAWLDRTRPD